MHQIQYAGLLDSDPHGQDVLTMQTARGAIGTLFAPQFSQAILGAIETMQYDAYNLGREREKTPGTIQGTSLGRLGEEMDPGPGFGGGPALEAHRERRRMEEVRINNMIEEFERSGGIVHRNCVGHVVALALPETVVERITKTPPIGVAKPTPASKRGRPFGPDSKHADETISQRNKRLRAKRIRSYMARNPGISKKLASVHIDRTYAD